MRTESRPPLPPATRGPLRPDTRKLLLAGAWILSFGLLCVLSMFLFFGGASRRGPHTNGGWLMLIFALGALPIGVLVMFLAIAKVIGDRSR